MWNYPALGHDPHHFEGLPSSVGVLPCKPTVFPFHKYVLGRHFQIMQAICFLSYFCPLILHSMDEPYLLQFFLWYLSWQFSLSIISSTLIN